MVSVLEYIWRKGTPNRSRKPKNTAGETGVDTMQIGGTVAGPVSAHRVSAPTRGGVARQQRKTGSASDASA